MQLTDKIKSDKPTLVNFYATWCGPCNMMKPQVEEAAQELGDRIHYDRIDIDQNPELAELLQIRSIPTTIVFKNGQVNWRQTGILPASSIIKLVEEIIG
ncbi:thioredoxin [Sphingobacterium sp. WOUb80]|uniref:thioredoxin n=1 Tax=Sphingobacterium sp. WOUb80 TaxID=3234028 RepID=UPI003CE6F549